MNVRCEGTIVLYHRNSIRDNTVGVFHAKITSTKNTQKKSLKELHEEITKEIGVFDLPMRCNPEPNFTPEPYVETYEEWLEEMEYEMSTMTPEEMEESEKRSQHILKMLEQINPKRFKEIKDKYERQTVYTKRY